MYLVKGLKAGAFALLGAAVLTAASVRAEDGYRLWLRYEPLPKKMAEGYRATFSSVVVPGQSKTAEAIRAELENGLSGLLGVKVPVTGELKGDGAILVGTPKTSPELAQLGLPLDSLGDEGYCIRSVRIQERAVTAVAANTEVGALYGTFHLLRLLQTESPVDALNIEERPKLQRRVLNHWDNLNGGIEWGYAGKSIWKWADVPEKMDVERMRDYARANASCGINGSVLNNVNADWRILTTNYLHKVASIADVFRPYGVRVYLSARFSAPIDIGNLKTADPFDPEVAAWWKAKADEIYALIPDFGGFLVKANSEGQPGPRTYDRTHLDGANMLAAALAPHNGIVMWRAFVYDYKEGYDRAAAAYDELKPFDGKFAPNVLLQVKNGPIDFMPREPFHPLFGAMPKTQLMPEFQIQQEYMGRVYYLAFLAPMWSEFFNSDTYAKGRGSSVGKVVDGSLDGQRITGVAGVANIGSDRSWTGHPFAQANWYAFGRLAWNHTLKPEQIAREWVPMTFTYDTNAVSAITRIMLESREAIVEYTMPLGLHHITSGHFKPGPWLTSIGPEGLRPDWTSTYYHRADEKGLGFDRTETGSKAVNCYHPPVRDLYGKLETCPDNLILWFHHVPWDYTLKSGRSLWEELTFRYHKGVYTVRGMWGQWKKLEPSIDAERWKDVSQRLEIQELCACHWRDACLLYFQQFAKKPIPAKRLLD